MIVANSRVVCHAGSLSHAAPLREAESEGTLAKYVAKRSGVRWPSSAFEDLAINFNTQKDEG
jgi:hypothetical protein